MATHIRPTPGPGLRWIVKRKRQDLLLLDFGLLHLEEGESLRDGTKEEEAVIHIFGGSCTIKGDDFEFKKVGDRGDVFDGKASAAYIPPRTHFSVHAVSRLSAAIFKAATSTGGSPQIIRPKDVRVYEVGQKNWLRQVHHVGVDNLESKALLFGETFNPPGNWSSYPPHKHDTPNPPHEAKMEELYFYRVHPPHGFGLQRVYTADGYNQVFVVEDGDVVTLPRGYHPVVSAPGYELYYFWVLAAFSERRMLFQDDPKHGWLKETR